MAVSEFSSVSSTSAASDQQNHQSQVGNSSQTTSCPANGRDPRESSQENASSSSSSGSSSSPPAGAPSRDAADQRRGGEPAEDDRRKSAGPRPHATDGGAGRGKRGTAAAPPPTESARAQKPAGVSSRRLSQLQMTHTMQAFASGRSSIPARSSKPQKSQADGETGARSGRGGQSGAQQLSQRPRWHGGSSVSSSRGIEFQRKKCATGAAVRRMCLYGSGALWLPAQQVLGEYAAAPGVAGQPSGRDDLRVLLQLQQHEGREPEDYLRHPWQGLPAGARGGRRNASNAVAAALVECNVDLGAAERRPRQRPAIRSLQSYYGSDDLHRAFAQTLKLINPLTGHTQVMAARKPGCAAAVVNIQNFDAYSSLQVVKPYSALRQKDSLQASHMGLMPVPGAERPERTRAITAYPELKRSHLGCKGAFITPLDDVPLCERYAGHPKKRVGYRWGRTVFEAPYATIKDNLQLQRQQQRRGVLLANGGMDSWQQAVRQQSATTEQKLQQQGSATPPQQRQQQQMKRDWHEWQGYPQEQQQPQRPQHQPCVDAHCDNSSGRLCEKPDSPASTSPGCPVADTKGGPAHHAATGDYKSSSGGNPCPSRCMPQGLPAQDSCCQQQSGLQQLHPTKTSQLSYQAMQEASASRTEEQSQAGSLQRRRSGGASPCVAEGSAQPIDSYKSCGFARPEQLSRQVSVSGIMQQPHHCSPPQAVH